MDSTSLNTLSLCSGIGMFEEGVRAGLDWLGCDTRVLAYAERDSYAAACLLARMDDAALEPAPIYVGDFAECEWRQFRGVVDLVSAGFPCQPWSCAGKQLGTDDERWLWPAIARIIGDVGPRFVFLENVPAIVSGGGLEYVLSDLASLGFDAEWLSLSAAEVGASHKRERIFILGWMADAAGAIANVGQRQSAAIGARRKSWIERCGGELAQSACGGFGELRQPSRSDGLTDGRDDALEHAASARGRLHAGSDGRASGESESQIRSGSVRRQQRPAVDEQSELSGFPLFAPGPADPAWREILRDAPWLTPAVVSGVRELATGQSILVDASRADQLRCCGNQVVAAQAATALVEFVRRIA